MTLASIIIPVGPYHQDIAQRAIASARAQTIDCTVLAMFDDEGRGAGWARNRMAVDAESPFLVFLDADDTLHPEFVERCARGYIEGAYMYTDWQLPSGEAIVLPDCTGASGWHEKRFHLVTTLLPRQLFDAVGGFDETMTALEDTDLYLKLAAMGVCGERVPFTGVTYHVDKGQRGKSARLSSYYDKTMDLIRVKYGRGSMGCGCGADMPGTAQGAKHEGDVAVFVMQAGNKSINPIREGQTRRYRGGNGKATWMSMDDARAYVQAKPDIFKLAQAQQPAKGNSPSRDQVLAMLEQAEGLTEKAGK